MEENSQREEESHTSTTTDNCRLVLPILLVGKMVVFTNSQSATNSKTLQPECRKPSPEFDFSILL
jgi:hypothetical protein